jgi:hypothetical protein
MLVKSLWLREIIYRSLQAHEGKRWIDKMDREQCEIHIQQPYTLYDSDKLSGATFNCP